MNNIIPDNLYISIKEVIEKARSFVSRAVNTSMVDAYWQIGRLIVKNDQKGEVRAEYGESIIENLAK